MRDFDEISETELTHVERTLRSVLEFAVPMWMTELRQCHPDTLVKKASRCAEVVAAHGDMLMFKSKPRRPHGFHGELETLSTAHVFNKLAEGIACAALISKGGITAFGLHFEDPSYLRRQAQYEP